MSTNEALIAALKLAVRQNSHDMLMTGEELRQCEAALAATPAADAVASVAVAFDETDLDFEPSEQYAIADMANIGHALMQALPEGYSYSDSPTEIVSDLQNKIADMEAAAAQPQADAAEPVRTEAQRWADDLAGYIGDMTGIEIGKHSTPNNPWFNACEAARDFIQQREAAQPAAATESVLIEGMAYAVPAAVAGEMLRLHIDAALAAAQPAPQALGADPDGVRYRLLRRGQHWSVIDGIGDTLRAEALDSAIDAVLAAATTGGQS